MSSGETSLRAFEYDEANRLTKATGPQGDEIEIGYDDDGNITAIDDGRGQSLTRDYDSRGNLVEQVDPRGTLEYGYDQLGRLVELTDPASGVFEFGYNPEGGLTEVDRPNGVVTSNIYDDAGRLAETSSEKANNALEALSYGYDPSGNVVARIDERLERETVYGYDALDRLTKFDPPGEGSTGYDYDEAGNRTEAGGVTYGYNALNQLTEASDGSTYGYDGAGRMIEMSKEAEETSYAWDLFDHPAKVEAPAGTAEYSYDAFGRLIERTGGSGTQATHYGDLTDLPTYEADGEGELTRSYVHGAGGLVEERSESAVYLLADARGDITALTNAAGTVSSRQSYDPWGTQLSGPNLEMGFLGVYQRRTDPASGLVQMGARSYDSGLGTFLSEDPLLGRFGLGQSLNRYAYVRGNPINSYDLNGRLTIEVPGTPIEIHPLLPTPGNPIPEPPISVDGVPSLPGLINDQIPNLPIEDDVEDRVNDFVKTDVSPVVAGTGKCIYEGFLNGKYEGSPCHETFEEIWEGIKENAENFETEDPDEPDGSERSASHSSSHTTCSDPCPDPLNFR